MGHPNSSHLDSTGLRSRGNVLGHGDDKKQQKEGSEGEGSSGCEERKVSVLLGSGDTDKFKEKPSYHFQAYLIAMYVDRSLNSESKNQGVDRIDFCMIRSVSLMIDIHSK